MEMRILTKQTLSPSGVMVSEHILQYRATPQSAWMDVPIVQEGA